MDKFKSFVPSLLVAVGIVVLGLCVKSGLGSFSRNARVVTVKGLAEKEVKADKVIWPIVYKELGNDLNALYNTINKKNKVVFDLLESKGITADEITTSVDVTDMDADAYTADRSPYRYRVSSIITVNTQKVDTVLALLKEQISLIQKGVAVTFSNYSYPSIQFEYTGLNDIKPEMIKEATRNARKAAEQFAIDSESKLGKIKTANQGQFSISDRDQNTPYIKNVRVVTTIQYMLED
ncbi:MAG: SIMPL domain-containing protein [Bacteroidetes bacterium]|uniref:SIMPL domain-containing protein n=1 Tax=Candidatus Limisoma faecipullorum TaxID=2840854 RepID=A0A9D9IM27_9BACT|nr:SIMPL domain-containing protein [Candidatus Limisoma faecipullorum]